MITKVSEITVNDLKNYLRLSDITEEDKKYLETIIKVAIDYIKNNTGLNDKELEQYNDLVIVVYVLILSYSLVKRILRHCTLIPPPS